MSDLRRLADFQDEFFQTVRRVGGGLIAGPLRDELTTGKDFPMFLKPDFSILINQIGALAAAKNLLDGIW
jgi:hypothetical protein